LFDTVRVADYLLDKDRLFAQLTLDEEEFGLYEQVYARLAVDAPVPDLVIYLQAPVDVLRERIERRGIKE
jgi:deoxyadenosine/deoxycytidine kinase